MKLTLWQGFKLSAWLITYFLAGLITVVYIVDYGEFSMSIMFYFNIIFITIFMWILLYLFKYIFRKLSVFKKEDKL